MKVARGVYEWPGLSWEGKKKWVWEGGWSGRRRAVVPVVLISSHHKTGRANDLQSGLIWINTWLKRDLRTPMGGMKHSGVGREGGFEAMRFFTEPKNVCIAFKKDGS